MILRNSDDFLVDYSKKPRKGSVFRLKIKVYGLKFSLSGTKVVHF